MSTLHDHLSQKREALEVVKARAAAPDHPPVALDVVGAEFVRSIEPGELVIVRGTEISSHRPFAPVSPRPCIFEYVYFSRPDSISEDRSVYTVRKAIGARPALIRRQFLVEASILGLAVSLYVLWREIKIQDDMTELKNGEENWHNKQSGK